MRRHAMMYSGLIAGFCLLMVGQQAIAADLGAPAYQEPAPRAHVAASAGGRVLDPRCRVIPQPEANLYGDTTRFRPTMVCMSRGLMADSFGPYPFYYPY